MGKAAKPHAKNGYKTSLKKELDYLNKQALLELKLIRHLGSDCKDYSFAIPVLSIFDFCVQFEV